MKKVKTMLFAMLLPMLLPAVATAQTNCPAGASTCQLTVVMADSEGDGWETGAVRLYQGGVLVGTTTMQPSGGFYGPTYETDTVRVCSGQEVVVRWTNDDYNSECSFVIYSEDGDELFSWNGTGGGPFDSLGVITTPCPTCPKLRGFAVAYGESGDATLTWTGSSDSYTLMYGLSGNDLADYDTIETTTSSATFDFLLYGELYDVYLFGTCGNETTDTAMLRLVLPMDTVSAFPFATGLEVGDETGWHFVNGSNAWTVGEGAYASGQRGLYVSDNVLDNQYTTGSSNSVSWAFIPFRITEAGTYTLNFDWKAGGDGDNDYARVWVTPGNATFTADQLPGNAATTAAFANTTPAGWIDVANRPLAQSNGWQTHGTTFTLTAVSHYNLVFMWANNSNTTTNPAIAIDNVELNKLTCPAPTGLTLDAATTNSLTVRWTAGGEESEWAVSIDNGTPVTVNDTTYTFNGLDANTEHIIKVRAVCGSDDQSLVIASRFRTPCEPISVLPWTEDFEADDALECYTIHTESDNYPRIVNTLSTNQGERCLRFSNAYSDEPEILVLPAFSADLSHLMLSFYMYTGWNSYSLEVGYMSDPSDASTFTSVGHFRPATASTWVKYENIFFGLDAEGYIAFRSTSMGAVSLDEITVAEVPSCMQPMAVNVSNVGTTTADVEIVDINSTGTYKMLLTHDGETDTIDVVGDSYTLTDLTENTHYSLAVVTVCDTGITAATRAAFTTACNAISNLPWSENFSSYAGGSSSTPLSLPCWTIISRGSGTKYPYISAYMGHGDSKSLFFSNGRANDPEIACLPAFSTPLTSLALSCWGYIGSAGTSLEVGVMTDPNDPATFTTVQTLSPAEGTWTEYTNIIFPNFSDGQIAFRQLTGTTFYLDDIMVEAVPSCLPPVSIAIDSVSTDYARVIINDPMLTNQYHAVLSTGSTTVANLTVMGNLYDFEDLTPGTAYTLTVSSLCSDGIETAALTLNFTTDCMALTIPYTEGFENGGEACWRIASYYSGNTTTQVTTTYVHSGFKSHQFTVGYSHQPVFAVMPRVDNVEELLLTFQVKAANYIALAVGTMTNPTDTNTFVPVYRASGQDNAWNEHIVGFDTVTTGAEYIAFRFLPSNNGFGYHIYLDDVVLEQAPSCPRPDGISLDDLGENYAHLVIDDHGNTYSYHVLLTSEGTSVFDDVIDDMQYLFEDLTPGTSYMVRVSSMCDDNTETTSQSLEFRTPCPAIATFPWTEEFEEVSALSCWTILDEDGNGQGWSRNEGGYARSPFSTLGTDDWLITPAIDIPNNASGLFLQWDFLGSNYPYGSNTHYEVLASTSAGLTPDQFSDLLFSENTNTNNLWVPRAVSLEDYGGMTVRFAFRHNVANDNGMSLDNVSVRYANVPEVTLDGPATVSIGTATAYTATTVGGSVTELTYTWSSDKETASQATMTTSGATATITYNTIGIDTLRVIATNPYGSDTATLAVTVVNPNPISTFPYTTGFEASDDLNWMVVGSGNTWTLGSATSNGGSRALYVSDNGGSSNSYTVGTPSVAYAYRTFDFATAGTYAVQFDWKCAGETNYDFGRAWVAPASNTFTAGQLPNGASPTTVNYTFTTPEGWIDLAGGQMNNQTAWTTDSATFDIATAGQYNLVFMWTNDDEDGTQPAAAIDNVEVRFVAAAPVMHTVTLATADATMGTVTPDGNTAVLDGTSFTATATATAGHRFVAWQQNGTQVSTQNPYTFTVTGDVALTATFEALPNVEYYTVSVSSADATMGSASSTHSGQVAENTTVTATATAAAGYRFVAWMQGGAQVSTQNPYTFTVTGDVALTATFVANAEDPCNAPSGLTAYAITNSSARVSWIANGGEDTWQLEVNSFTITVQENPYVLTGLNEGATFTLRVRAVCGDGYSDWSPSFTFTTLVGIEDADGSQLRLYPNPASSTVTIDGLEGAAKVTLVDINGRVNGVWRTESGELTIDVTGLPRGTYFVRVTGEQMSAIRKLIVK